MYTLCHILYCSYYYSKISVILFAFHLQALYYVGLGFWIAFLDLFTGHHRTLDSIFDYHVSKELMLKCYTSHGIVEVRGVQALSGQHKQIRRYYNQVPSSTTITRRSSSPAPSLPPENLSVRDCHSLGNDDAKEQTMHQLLPFTKRTELSQLYYTTNKCLSKLYYRIVMSVTHPYQASKGQVTIIELN